MLFAFIKAFLMGVIVAAPPGPVLFFVMQKTVCDSRKAGLYAGMGSAIADTVYAAVAVFALGLVKDFIDKNTPLIMLVGGLLVALVGWNMARKKVTGPVMEGGTDKKPFLWYSGQTMVCAFSNPAALFVAMFILAVFKLDSASLNFPAWLVLPFVFVGEISYWTLLTFLFKRFLHPGPRFLNIFSRGAGLVIVVFGLYLLVKGVIGIVATSGIQ